MENLASKLANGKTVFGTCIVSSVPIWAKGIQGLGLDFVFIDTEHIPIDRTELTAMCSVYNAMGLSPIVRIPQPDPYLACMARDAGAVGILAPYVEQVGEVLQMVGATKYRPLKGERLSQVLVGTPALPTVLKEYLHEYNQGSLCLINIESVAAVDNLNTLLAVPGLDGVVIGPHDLSVNMGLPEAYDHPDFEKMVEQIIVMAREAGLAAGIHFPSDPQRQVKWAKIGANIVLHSSDMFLFREKLRDDMAVIKRDLGKDTGPAEASQFVI